jgi:hypothetical protein
VVGRHIDQGARRWLKDGGMTLSSDPIKSYAARSSSLIEVGTTNQTLSDSWRYSVPPANATRCVLGSGIASVGATAPGGGCLPTAIFEPTGEPAPKWATIDSRMVTASA